MQKIDSSLFDGQKLDAVKEKCPQCDSALTIKNSKSGPFIGCTSYPDCDYIKPLADNSVDVVKDLEASACELCGAMLQIKKGRYGLFIGCSDYPSCDFVASLSEPKQATHVNCPVCANGQLIEKTNRYGKRFFSCTNYPNCKYVVNFAPVMKTCPQCDWSILVKKAGKLYCPQKGCRYSEDDSSE